jgi:hypothetical protein
MLAEIKDNAENKVTNNKLTYPNPQNNGQVMHKERGECSYHFPDDL